jgi:hypothetical protein
MVEVCSVVDREMSPIRASAPVFKIPIAMPEINVLQRKMLRTLPQIDP